MKVTQVLGMIALALLVLVLAAGGCVYSGYNRVIGLDEQVKTSWAQVETQLQRRYDLIPNLVATVKGTAAQEKSVLLGIAEARKSYLQANTVADKAKAATQVESALIKVLSLQENYPDLKSNQAFLKLQDQLEGTENRVSVERERYNDAVRVLNTTVRQFPGSIFAALAGVKEAEYFKVEEAAKTPPKVDFSADPPLADEARWSRRRSWRSLAHCSTYRDRSSIRSPLPPRRERPIQSQSPRPRSRSRGRCFPSYRGYRGSLCD